ncbi:unnamed protein product [Eruca vesicaria subsp. sativa]|uniref:Uncharacterized protein n=1 Tax=Eruca vesicaria subsp. sativa TaxID=29727 RepID=A0ABC8JMI6_ERUVS|nr:unnamed protein product [Eruca vesicaria subsp. sativa]
MRNISLKASLLIFILIITSDFGTEARELTEVEVMAGNSNYAVFGMSLDPAHPLCKRNINCTFECPKRRILQL